MDTSKITEDFDTFVDKITLNADKVNDIIAKHNSLTNMIKSNPPVNYKVYKTRLSGSYAKHTTLNETDETKKPDVDVVLYIETEKEDVGDINSDFLEYFKDKKMSVTSDIRQQSNSIGLIYSGISVDFVIAKCDEKDNLRITCHKNNEWIDTNAIKQVDFMSDRKKQYESFNYHSLMKLFKYLNKERLNNSLKSYTLEQLVHTCVPSPKLGQTLPQMFVDTLESITKLSTIDDIKDSCDKNKTGYDEKDKSIFPFFKEEMVLVYNNAKKALNEDDKIWEDIFGDLFPKQQSTKREFIGNIDKTHTPWCDEYYRN